MAGENQGQEFKSSFSKEAIETITAFANSTGGSVYIGIDNRGNIKGVEIGKETLQNWQNQIKLNTRPSLFPDIEVMDIDDKKIVSLAIQEHPIKPVSCRGKYYQRKKNANHQMTITEISDCHLKTFNTSWDFYQAATHTIEDLSLNKINGFIVRANAIRPFLINDDPLTVLKKFELLMQDKITNGSHLLFMAEESAISTIEAGRFSSDTIIKDSITIRTDLFSEVDLVFEFIKKHISRGYYFKGKAQREERWEYPLEAIREIIINMIVHRDYMAPGDSIIKIFDESIPYLQRSRAHRKIRLRHQTDFEGI
ncbi:MAG: putative DNA binding domain-containing protein [Desulfobacteraceae bacterium]|nr:putative DNA binding domain-containing protein [Desulfobacteraceae bacterium]